MRYFSLGVLGLFLLTTDSSAGEDAKPVNKTPVTIEQFDYDAVYKMIGGRWECKGDRCDLVVLGPAEGKPGLFKVVAYNEYKPSPQREDMLFDPARKLFIREGEKYGMLTSQGVIQWLPDRTTWTK